MDFSCSGKLLLTVGLDDDHSIGVWRWQEGEDLIFYMEVPCTEENTKNMRAGAFM